MTSAEAMSIKIEDLLQLPHKDVVEILHLRDSYLNSIVIGEGKSAYDIAVLNGYDGTVVEWLLSLKGSTAYQIAVEYGFVGTKEEWLESLKGKDAIVDYSLLFQYFEEHPEEFIDAISKRTAQIIGIDGIINFKRENVIGFQTDSKYGSYVFTDSAHKSLEFVKDEATAFTIRFARKTKTLRMT
jgi:hypothetical protein